MIEFFLKSYADTVNNRFPDEIICDPDTLFERTL